MIFYRIDVELKYGEHEVFCHSSKKVTLKKALEFIELQDAEDKALLIYFEKLEIKINKESVIALLIGSQYADDMTVIFNGTINDFIKRYGNES